MTMQKTERKDGETWAGKSDKFTSFSGHPASGQRLEVCVLHARCQPAVSFPDLHRAHSWKKTSLFERGKRMRGEEEMTKSLLFQSLNCRMKSAAASHFSEV